MAASTAVQVVVSPLLGVIFDNLSSLIQKEVGLIWGVEEEMKKLASILSAIRDVLEDAEEKQNTEKAVANWLLKLKDLAYDADDILDEWETEARELQLRTEHVACSKQVCASYFSCFSFAQLVFRRKIAKRVNDLREKFDNIVREKSGLGLRVGVAGSRPEHYRSRETSSLPTDLHVFGREEEQDFIVRQILDNVGSEAGLSVHPIVGIGGLGKTTLAQVCFNDLRIQEHFDPRVWVCVSDNFDVKRLTKAFINSIVVGTCNLEELDPLQRLLQEKLAQKRFLLVLDDVWNEDQEEWSKFRNSLRCGAVGSSVIVTTRLETVASITGTRAPLFLKFLAEDDCWSLFRQRAFGTGNDESPKLLKIGQEIVKKCRGVPLVAKVLGGLLRFKRGEKEWLNVRDSRIWELPQTDANTILPALRLSYNHLAPHLRQCFTYCAVFPKDHRMKKDDLIRLWMANGFIQSKARMQMEDIGNGIFDELLWRSFFQDEEKDFSGLVVSCMMHDLIHDLACSINMNECYHLAEGTQIREVHLGMRHLSIQCAKKSSLITEPINQITPNLRTMILLQYNCHDELISEICLKSLRVLDLKPEKGIGPVKRELLHLLGNLKHLRYLSISSSNVRKLPDSLCELKNLQTLALDGCERLERLPERMGNVSTLRHLNIRRCYSLSKMPAGMGNLIWLHTLSFFIVHPCKGCGIQELQRLDYLSGEVEIKGLDHVKTREEAKKANLMKKQSLSSLKLVWSNVDSDGETQRDVLEGLQPHPNLKRLVVEWYKGSVFPSWLDLDLASSLPNLIEIGIYECSRCEHLPCSLGLLPVLRRLMICTLGSVKFFIANSYDDAIAFPLLEELNIDGMDELEDWFPARRTCVNSNSEHVIHHFPHLQELGIWDCPKLKRLPPCPLSSLQELVLQNCNQMILRSLQNLPTLSSLQIYSFNDITCFPEESLQNLPSLKYLHISFYDSLRSLPLLIGVTSLLVLSIRECPNLTNLSLALRYQTSLQALSITNCPKADILAVEYQHLSSLQKLGIGGHDMMNLPDGLLHLSSTLQELKIGDMSALNSLPDWIGSFTNLKTLYLEHCKNVTSLPDGIQQLINLQVLKIWKCHREVHRRCARETGEDWPKIAHVPKFDNNP